MLTENPHDDLVFRALASAVRRRILDCLREESLNTGDLATRFPDLSRYAVMQHLSVLVEAGLVLVHREGRVRWNSLNAVPLQRVFERWMTPYRSVWAQQLLEIKEEVEKKKRARRKRGT